MLKTYLLENNSYENAGNRHFFFRVVRRLILRVLIVLVAGLTGSVIAEECNSPTVVSKARDTFVPLFRDPPDLSGTSTMPFHGVLREVLLCPDKKSVCRLTFAVKEIFFDFTQVFADAIHLKRQPEKVIVVNSGSQIRYAMDLPIGSEWLVVAINYGATDDGLGKGFNPSCGEWLGEIRGDQIYFNNKGDYNPQNIIQRSWSEVRGEILQPITSAGPEGKKRLEDFIATEISKLKK